MRTKQQREIRKAWTSRKAGEWEALIAEHGDAIRAIFEQAGYPRSGELDIRGENKSLAILLPEGGPGSGVRQKDHPAWRPIAKRNLKALFPDNEILIVAASAIPDENGMLQTDHGWVKIR